MFEKWKDIKGYEGRYQVSNLGRIKSLARTDRNGVKRKEKIRIPRTDKKGYQRINLSDDCKVRWHSVHRLVAEAFVERKNDLDQIVNHLDNNPHNNRADNLEWTTYKGNMQWASLQGRMKGNEVGKANLRQAVEKRKTPVIAIDANGNRFSFSSQVEAAKALNVNSGHIAAACRKEYGYQRLNGYSFEYADKNKQKSAEPKRKKMNDEERLAFQRNLMLGNQHSKGRKPTEKNIMASKRKLGKPVLQIDAYGNVVAEFLTCNDAKKATGIPHIYDAANGKRKTAGSYYWRWKNT